MATSFFLVLYVVFTTGSHVMVAVLAAVTAWSVAHKVQLARLIDAAREVGPEVPELVRRVADAAKAGRKAP